MILIGELWQILFAEALWALPMWVWGLLMLGVLDMFGLYMIIPYTLAISVAVFGYLRAYKSKPKNEIQEAYMKTIEYKITTAWFIVFLAIGTFLTSHAEVSDREGIGRFLASIDAMIAATPGIIGVPVLIGIAKWSGEVKEQYKKPVKERKTFYKISHPIGVIILIAVVVCAIVLVIKNPENMKQTLEQMKEYYFG